MQLFELVSPRLFRPLAGPNRAFYAELLLLLWEECRHTADYSISRAEAVSRAEDYFAALAKPLALDADGAGDEDEQPTRDPHTLAVGFLLRLRRTGWLEEHPDTDFIFFFSPYSILFWDKMDRLGETDAMLTMLDEATKTLLAYDNAEIQFFMADFPVITNLDNYADHIHVAGRVTYQMSRAMPEGTYRLTAENRAEVLDALREFVVHYDYDKIWAEQP